MRLRRELLSLPAKQPVFVMSGLITGLVLGVRFFGWLQNLDVVAYDQMMRWQPATASDSRLLIVGITESDIAALKQYPLSDDVIAQTLAKLQSYRPKAIGLDLYRDVPHPPGQSQLLKQLQAPNVIAIESYNTVPAPPSVPRERIGFNDLLLDADGVVRRNLLFTTVGEERYYSFSLRLSLQYLSSLSERNTAFRVDGTALRIGDASFYPLQTSAGGYETIEDLGYQTLLRYRTANPIARQVSLSQVLKGEIDADWVRDKVVLIGTTAPNGKDTFFTPYTGADRNSAVTPGVEIHAQMVSQILSAVLDGRSPLRYWHDWAEALWILGWSVVGGTIAWRLKHPFTWGVSGAIATASLIGTSFVLFLNAVWIPIIPPLIALIGTKIIMLSYRQLYDASHDLLTQLPNRDKFTQSLQKVAQHAKSQPNPQFAVLWLGLDRFQVVNESLGHKAANQILQTFARQLKLLHSELCTNSHSRDTRRESQAAGWNLRRSPHASSKSHDSHP